MINKMKKLIALLAIMMFLASCGAKKSIAANSEVPAVSSNKNFYDAITKKSDFDALKITSKIDAEVGKFVPTIHATIYIENNQKIWMNMSALFMNVGRGIATPQGLKAYEKLSRTYIDSDFSYLNNLLKVNFLDYSSLQNLLVGKVFFPVNEKDFNLTKEAEEYILKPITAQKVNIDGKTSEYLTEFRFSNDLNLIKVSLKDTKTADNLELFYDNWVDINGVKLPKNVKIVIKGKKTDQILIENTKFDFSRMETPYSVPNNYKKRDF